MTEDYAGQYYRDRILAQRISEIEFGTAAEPMISSVIAREIDRGSVMARVFYLHWNRDEAEARAAALKKAGHDVRLQWSTEEHVKLGDFTPEAVIISLDRLPSHGRAVAEWFWEAKKRQSIPIVFAGGAPEKVEATRARFQRAIFCASDDVARVLLRVLH